MRKTKQDSRPLQLDLFASDALPVLLPPPSTETEKPPVPLKKRVIELSGTPVEYEFRRSKRRTIGFLINENGLRVTAPKWVTLKSIEEAIREKEHWIIRKLRYFFNMHEKRQAAPQQLTEGMALPYLGRNLVLRLRRDTADSVMIEDATDELVVTTGNTTVISTIEENLKSWFQEKARQVFAERLPIYAAMLGVTYRSFSLSSARQRWGSCSVSGNIRLNWRLIHFPPALIDYVVVHELAHLREMNHSKRFWDIVSAAYPDYMIARKQLNQQNMKILSLF
ncbi:M48 family metallopeptidase [Oxalobacter sp. OttesenSCG-928-P03]|nr:M48 family metallopeptidase [Oxalobacter sp. OttesenSCG-928-P03]